MDIVQALRQDYARFPQDQSYELYAQDVYFQDPMNEFRGVGRYKLMIGFIRTWFLNCKMDLHQIERSGNLIQMEWTLSWNTPLPWKPRIAIPGRSELTVETEGETETIVSHIDYWHCSKLEVLQQHFQFRNQS
jgi:Uncharacterized conserved protein (DUF2358)